ncbi:NAD(P)-binding protein [Annulohypoxylon maeteangense]|uniref:NAD(P)-binding protein n=1 Tax=Annulohypoxylon maeteangense TaxID=1927788 RepID=UPI002008B714|nr:NAD(P)-binding protein [Annulohypoxylon maeteangense]KAI0883857.1 NAD(P)-binding protein [Annulohypoxylon maeteangense]
MSKVFIVTGASRGIGFAIAQALIQASHKVFLVARTEKNLQELKTQHATSVDFITADLADWKVAPKVIESTVKAFGKIDGIVVNHGVLAPITKISESSVEEWRHAYDINVFSALALVKEAIPELRKSQGRVVFVSSGAAFGAYAGWGSYGTSKAALTHLSTHLAVEEPSIISVAVSPGKVDTDMQKQIRNDGKTGMAPEVYASFVDEYKNGQFLDPKQPGDVIAKLVEGATSDLSGKYFRWNAAELANFRAS